VSNRVAIGRALQPFPRSKRSRHVSAHSAFRLGLWTLQGRIRRCRRRSAPASKGHHLRSSLHPFASILTGLPWQSFTVSWLLPPGVWLVRCLRPPVRPLAFSRPTSVGQTALEFPSSTIRDVPATRSCLLNAERLRDSAGGRKDPACPPPPHFGPGVSATFTCLLLRRLRRFLIVSIGHRDSPIIRRVAGRGRFIVHRLHTPRCATP
jgi:hypothetical protein